LLSLFGIGERHPFPALRIHISSTIRSLAILTAVLQSLLVYALGREL
jgi:hypothetical protein